MKLSTHIHVLVAGAALASLSLGAVAQTTNPAPMGSTQAPTAIGVTPQTAAEANRNAVPRSDTATVVRTGPNAADAARSAASTAQGSSPTMGNDGTMRAARADRN